MIYNTKSDSLGEWQAPTKIWNKMFVSIFFTNMMLNLGSQMSNNLLAKYADYLGAPASQVGMLMSMFAVTAIISRFIASPAMDAFNRKYLVMCAIGLMSMTYIGFSLSRSVGMLMVFRLIQGVGNACANACCLAIASDVLPGDKFNTGIGYFSCAQVVSTAIGPTVALQVVKWFGYSTAFSINATVMAIAILTATQVKPAPRTPRKFNLKPGSMIAKEALVPAAIVLSVATGFTVINSLLIVYAGKRGVEDGIGFFFTVYSLTLLVTRPAIGRLTERYGFVKIGIPAILVTAFSLAFIGFSTNLWMFLVVAFINAFGYGALQPALQTLCVKSVPADRRGSASSTYYIAYDAATLVGPAVAGFVAQIAGYTPIMWVVMTIPLFFGILVAFFSRHSIDLIERRFSQN